MCVSPTKATINLIKTWQMCTKSTTLYIIYSKITTHSRSIKYQKHGELRTIYALRGFFNKLKSIYRNHIFLKSSYLIVKWELTFLPTKPLTNKFHISLTASRERWVELLISFVAIKMISLDTENFNYQKIHTLKAVSFRNSLVAIVVFILFFSLRTISIVICRVSKFKLNVIYRDCRLENCNL